MRASCGRETSTCVSTDRGTGRSRSLEREEINGETRFNTYRLSCRRLSLSPSGREHQSTLITHVGAPSPLHTYVCCASTLAPSFLSADWERNRHLHRPVHMNASRFILIQCCQVEQYSGLSCEPRTFFFQKINKKIYSYWLNSGRSWKITADDANSPLVTNVLQRDTKR